MSYTKKQEKLFSSKTEKIIKKFLDHHCGTCSKIRRIYLEDILLEGIMKYGFPKKFHYPKKNLKLD